MAAVSFLPMGGRWKLSLKYFGHYSERKLLFKVFIKFRTGFSGPKSTAQRKHVYGLCKTLFIREGGDPSYTFWNLPV